MSRNSDAKQARRRKRQAARSAGRNAGPEPDPVAGAVARFNDWIVGRGWALDAETGGDEVVSWVYPPSACEVGDDGREPVTRIWIAMNEDDDALVLEFGAALVGSGPTPDDGLYLLDPETLADDIAGLEAYRPGDARPVLN